MRIVFAGTPEFAVAPLKALLGNSGHEVCAVYCQPDRPTGRGRKMVHGPVKALALAHGVQVFQPETLKDPAEVEQLRALEAELMVVVAYGLILPKAVLEIPSIACINIHASLLPQWRGAAPIQRAVEHGDKVSGVTIMLVEPKLDAGPMLLKKDCPIHRGETAGELHDRLSLLGAEALLETLPSLENGTFEPVIQDEALATYAPKLEKAEARLDWHKGAGQLERQVLAFNPWPVAETLYQGNVLRIWRAEAVETETRKQPGTVLESDNQFLVATGAGVLKLLELQLPGGNRVSDRDFLNANSVAGCVLGNNP